MNCAHCLKLVDAFVDAEVDTETAVQMREHMERCPPCKAAIEERRSLGGLVRSAGDSEGVPKALREAVREKLDVAPRGFQVPRRPRWWQAWGLAAAVAALSVAATLALVDRPTRRDAVLVQLVDRHVAALATVPASGKPALQFAADERHRLKPWFQGRVPLSPPVVDLSAAKVELLGGRVERIESGDAAVVVYRIRHHPIDLFAWRDGKEDAVPHADTLQGFSIVRWSSGGLAYAAVSDLNRTELERFAHAVIDEK